MKTPTKGPIEHEKGPTESWMQRAFSDEPQLYLMPRLGRREVVFIASGIYKDDGAHIGSIDVDDVSVVMEAGNHQTFGPVCHIDTKDGRGYLVQGDRGHVEKQLFGDRDENRA